MISKNDPDYIFEEYKGHIIASHKDNVVGKDIDNSIIVYNKKDFPEYGFIMGLDDSKMSGRRKSFPHNIEDAKSYIDILTEGKQISNIDNPVSAPRTIKEIVENVLAEIRPDNKGLEPELPEIDIEGTTFFFDIDTLSLVEKDNQANDIRIIDMWNFDTHYAFNFSNISKNSHWISFNPSKGNLIDDLPNSLKRELIEDPPIYVEIPRIGIMDPERMMQKYGCTAKDIALKTDFEIMVDQDAFKRRINGEPVTIDLIDKKYEIDVVNNLLRPQDGVGEEILLNKFHYNYYYEDMGVYHLFYNISEHRAVDVLIDGSRDQIRDRVILEVPNLYSLDPVGYGLSKGEDPRFGLLDLDMQLNHVALAVPWEFYNIKVPANDESIYRPERVLPIYRILHTEFLVDIDKLELRERLNEQNVISFSDMDEYKNGYGFNYNRKSKNIATHNERTDLRVELPRLVELNPLDMAMKYGLGVSELESKSDFELLVDQDALDKRINQGMLPIIEISGHPFYVDLRMDKLRPKDDFLSKGIAFFEIGNFFDTEKQQYVIPYNPHTHEFQEINYNTITQIPDDLIVVSFPHQRVLDPVGTNILSGFDPTFDLTFRNLKMRFKASNANWDDLSVPQKIEANLDRTQKDTRQKNRIGSSRKNGRKL